MKLQSAPEPDPLYVDFDTRAGAAAREIADRAVVDFDGEGRPVGTDMQNALGDLDLSTIETRALPASRMKLS